MIDNQVTPPSPVKGAKKRSTKKMTNEAIYAEAIRIVSGEKQRWEMGTAFITDRVSFKMRNLIRILRKNYWGIFDEPIDRITGLEKIWYPLTEINVEAVVKNVDLDQKDLNFRATNEEGYAFTDLTRAYVKERLRTMDFGQKLDDFERALAIDGTAVWKTYEEQGQLRVQLVDLLNIYIEPTAPSIQEAYRFTERSLMYLEEFSNMTAWMHNKPEDLTVTEGLPRTDPYWMARSGGLNSNVKARDVYETWGKIPLSLISGLVADAQTEVEGHLVVSGIDTPGKEVVHLIELNKRKDKDGNIIKPYEEAWYTRVPNRWYGRGIAEKLLTLQVYANMVFNFRINRSRMSQLGIFKVKKGAGVTPQMLSRVQSNGVVVLNDLADLEQLVVQEVGATSYKDEDTINNISERLTNAFEVATGEALPSSTPATNAAIQSAAAKSGFQIIKDQLGFFLQRWMDRHALPIFAKQLKANDIVRISMDEGNYEDLVNRATVYYTMNSLKKTNDQGFMPDPVQIVQAMVKARAQLRKRDLFTKVVQTIQTSMLETHFFVTNEDMDVTTTVNNLIALIPAAPEYRDAMLKMAFDLMGIGQLQKAQPPQPQQPQQGAPQPGAGPGPVPGAIPNGPPGAPPAPILAAPTR